MNIKIKLRERIMKKEAERKMNEEAGMLERLGIMEGVKDSVGSFSIDTKDGLITPWLMTEPTFT